MRVHMEYTGEDAEEMQGTLCGDGGSTSTNHLAVTCIYCLRVQIMDLRSDMQKIKIELQNLKDEEAKRVADPRRNPPAPAQGANAGQPLEQP